MTYSVLNVVQVVGAEPFCDRRVLFFPATRGTSAHGDVPTMLPTEAATAVVPGEFPCVTNTSSLPLKPSIPNATFRHTCEHLGQH